MLHSVGGWRLVARPGSRLDANQGNPGQDRQGAWRTSARVEAGRAVGAGFKNNPDIRLAEARLKEAEAYLNKTRLDVLQKIATTEALIRGAEAALEEATARFAQVKELHARGMAPAEELQSAEATLLKFKADLEVQRAALPALLGQARRRCGSAAATPRRRLRN